MAKKSVFKFKVSSHWRCSVKNAPSADLNEHNISPNQLRNWKTEFLKMPQSFSESRDEKELRAKEKEMDNSLDTLMAKSVNSP